MIQTLLTLVAGFAVGAVFSLMGAPVPAPPTLTGVLGIAGLTLGYIVAARV